MLHTFYIYQTFQWKTHAQRKSNKEYKLLVILFVMKLYARIAYLNKVVALNFVQKQCFSYQIIH